MKRGKKLAAVLGVALVLCAGAGSAGAYFTDHVEAVGGGFSVETGDPETKLTERFQGWTKYVSVENTGEIPVYVRVRAFCGGEYRLVCEEGETWRESGGFYYYTGNGGILYPGEKAPELPIKIHGVDEAGNLTEIPDVPEENREKFGVVVVSERTPLQYDGAGEALAPEEADWKSYRPVEWREGGEDR